MRGNIFISAVSNQHINGVDTKYHTKREKRDYTLIKIKTRPPIHFGNEVVNGQITSMKLVYTSEVIYDVSKQEFYKTRFDINGVNSAIMLPDSLEPLFSAIISVSANKTIEELKELHNKQNLIEAIYLTDTLSNYIDDFNFTEYQLMRFRYGKEINYDFLKDIEEKFPEHLI